MGWLQSSATETNCLEPQRVCRKSMSEVAVSTIVATARMGVTVVVNPAPYNDF